MKITLSDYVVLNHGFAFGVGETSAEAKMNAAKILPAAIDFPAYQVAWLVSYDPVSGTADDDALTTLACYGLELDI